MDGVAASQTIRLLRASAMWVVVSVSQRYGIGEVPDVIGALVGAASCLSAAYRRASPRLTVKTIGP